jgi:hypothetical protein
LNSLLDSLILQARSEHFVIDKNMLEYHFADLHFYMKEHGSATQFPAFVTDAHILTADSRVQMHPQTSSWPPALLESELLRAQTTDVLLVTDEFIKNALQRFEVLPDVKTPLENWVKRDRDFYTGAIAQHLQHLDASGKAPKEWEGQKQVRTWSDFICLVSFTKVSQEGTVLMALRLFLVRRVAHETACCMAPVLVDTCHLTQCIG